MSFRVALIVPFLIGAIRGCGAPPPRTEAAAAELRESVGANLHLEYDDTPYADAQHTLSALQQVGIHHVRDAAMRSGPERVPRFETLARAGVRFDLFVNRDLPAQLAAIERLQVEAPGSVDLIEGPNEANHEPFGDFAGGNAPAAQAYQRRLDAAVKKIGVLSKIPVAALTYWPPLVGQADWANFHAYPDMKRPPGPQLTWMRVMAAAVQPPKSPVVCTETGFTTAGESSVTEDQQSSLTIVLLLENFRARVARTYLYELFDEHPDPNELAPNRENHFGLFRQDGSPKPVAASISRFMQLLKEPTGSGQMAQDDRLSLNGRGLRTLTVTRSDGARVTFAWWSDAQAVTSRTLLATVAPGTDIRTLDLASGEMGILGPGSKIVTMGESPIAFLQLPTAQPPAAA